MYFCGAGVLAFPVFEVGTVAGLETVVVGVVDVGAAPITMFVLVGITACGTPGWPAFWLLRAE